MNPSAIPRFLFPVITLIFLFGCSGGGGGASTGDASGISVSGVAATGSAISGTICLRDAAAHEICVATSDGHYNFNVTGLTPPFILKAVWDDNGTPRALYSMSAGNGTANISPLTQAIVTEAAAQAPASLYASPSQTTLSSAATNLSSATTKLLSALDPLLKQYVGSSSVDPITTPYQANHTGLDQFLDNTSFSFANNAMILTSSVSGDLLYHAPDTDIDHGVSSLLWGSAEGQVAEDPSVAVDNNGNAVVLWSQYDSGTGRYHVESKWLHGSRASARVSNGVASCAAPRVVFGQDGVAHAVWYQATTNYTTVWYAKYIPATGWSSSIQISQHPSTYAYYPQLAVDASGNVVVVWYESNPPVGNHFDVYAVICLNGAWGTPVQLSQSTHSAYRPMVAVNDAGQATAVWPQDIGDGSVSNDYKQIAVSRWSGSAWSAPAVLNDIPGTTINIAAQVAVAVDSAGDPLVLWSQGNIRASWFVNGAWTASQDITSGAGGGCTFPEVVFYAPGRAMAVWRQHNGVSRTDVAASLYTAGSGWAAPVFISERIQSAESPHLAVDAGGTAAVVWAEGVYPPDTQPAMKEALYYPGSGWSAPVDLATLSGIGGLYFPVTAIGANRAGVVYSVWGLDSM